MAGHRDLTCAALALLLARAGTASAEEPWPPPAPRYRALLSSTFGLSYNAEGFEEQVRLGVQMLLFRSDSPVFRDNFVFLGVSPRINPIGARLGPTIEIQPLTVLNVRMTLDFCDYFGSFSSLQSFQSPLADFSSSARARGEELGRSYGSAGIRLSISPGLQGKIGPIVVRDRLTYEYFSMNLRPGDTTYYEPALDTLAPGKGTVISNDLDVFFLHDLPSGGFFSHGRIAAGARYTLFEPMFDQRDFRPGDDRTREHNEVHRIGPLVAFSLFDDGATKFHEPTIVALVQWYAAHRNRTGRDERQAVPYIVLAFIFQSDLWTSDGQPR
jgi:hypothetical protein